MTAPTVRQPVEQILLRLLNATPAAPSFYDLRPPFARALGIRIPKEPVGKLWVLFALGSVLHQTLAALEEAGLARAVTIKRRRLWMLTERGRRAVEEPE